MVKQKTVIVTGASRGIGAAICHQLLETGFKVIAVCRSDPKLDGVIHFACDLMNRELRKEVFSELETQSDIFGLINNAGIATPNLISEFDIRLYSEVMELNAHAVAELTATIVPSMIKQKQGRIVNISTELILGFPSRTAYSASKAAVSSFVRTWALELGQHNICCNAVAPGPVTTKFFDQNNPEGSDVRKNKLRKVPLGRFGQPEDIANMVSFLLSEKASFITGQTIYVCGGSSLGSVSF